jgi:hypothetical protein
MMPAAAAAGIAAAACAPIVLPLLPVAAAAGGAGALAAALAQVGGVGSGLLTEAVLQAWKRVRAQPDEEQEGLRKALAAVLEERLGLDTPAAASLRTEVAGVLRQVDAVQVALTAANEQSASTRAALVRGLRGLGAEFAEFGWVLDEVNQQLTVIGEDAAQAAAASRATADSNQQILVEVSLLRAEARGERPGAVWTRRLVPGMPSGDAKRAARLDAEQVPVSAECPYLGLASFQPTDAGRFFGRERLTAELVAKVGELLVRPGLLVVVGASGSGKSSLLRAGLLPTIAAGGLPARGSRTWPRDMMTPGRHPLRELAARIAFRAGLSAVALEGDLRADPGMTVGAIRQLLLADSSRRANALGHRPGGFGGSRAAGARSACGRGGSAGAAPDPYGRPV